MNKKFFFNGYISVVRQICSIDHVQAGIQRIRLCLSPEDYE